MTRGTILLLFILLSILSVSAQNTAFNPLQKPNTFRNADNPHYWQNKKPFAEYWQQDVHYIMHVNIDEKKNLIEGDLTLHYWNNSPDTLHELYFHLFQNAFSPCSYYADLHENNNVNVRFGKNYESNCMGNEVWNLTCNGDSVTTELDNTILKVIPAKPIPPNTKSTVTMNFISYYDLGSMRRRMKYFYTYGYKEFNGAHWYPRLACYDRKFGWTTDQHLGHEFYGDMGCYDVELTFANNYIVEATGFLTNRKEVLPDTLREKLDVKNFADKEWGSKPSVIVPFDSTVRKTWKFHAENVHDFAFIANPIFRLGESEWNGIKTISVVQEPHCSKWQNAADYTADIIRVFSEDIGMYGYHKMIVSDARDGMEYPMLTMDAGKDPSYRGLLVHEVGHNWFFGMVNTNETYRAAMDEGFTQFLTAWGLERIDGPYMVTDTPENWYVKKFRRPIEVRNSKIYYSYLYDAMRFQDMQLNTHSDQFNGAIRHGGGYRHAYVKMAAMLYNLQYVLGDSLFLDAMQNYFNEWSYCHPYFEDFRHSVINYTKVDLNWFFDQWFETTKNIDYAVGRVKKGDEKGEYKITFKRKGEMQMPLDFDVVLKGGETKSFHIPNNWFEKETDAEILPRWIGWQNLKPTYTATVKVDGKIKDVIIDPSLRLADINMLNNTKKPKTEVNFDSKLRSWTTWKKPQMFLRPDLWYNAYDGIKVGFHMRGHYMKRKHVYSLSVFTSTRLGRWGLEDLTDDERKSNQMIGYDLRYSTGLDKFLKRTHIALRATDLDGVDIYSLSIVKTFPKRISLSAGWKTMFRSEPEYLTYLIYPTEWQSGMLNNSINLGLDYRYGFAKGYATLNVQLRSSSLGSDYDYHYMQATYKNVAKVWKLQLRSRIFGRAGTGSNLAPESAVFLAGANPEEMMNNPYYRSRGFFPGSWNGPFGTDVNHLHFGGGMNLRGYAGYLAGEIDQEGVVSTTYKGSSAFAVNLEVDLDGILDVMPKWWKQRFKLDVYLFGDAGTIVYENSGENNEFSNFRADAGLGMAFTFKRFWKLQEFKPLTIRFDMPYYLSHAPAVSDNNWEFRFVLGIKRAF